MSPLLHVVSSLLLRGHHSLLLALALLLSASVTSLAAAAPSPGSGGYVEGQKTLEGRLLAPCCWNQTLDIHESEVASQLKREIRERLQAGERAEAIEASIVARYGERIRAVPEGKSLTSMGVWLSVVFAFAGLGAVALVVRWVRKGRGTVSKPEQPSESEAPRDQWDDKLDRELADE